VGVVIVAGACVGAWHLMHSDAKPPRKLGDGFTDVTGRRERWAAALSPREPAKLRAGVR
jgi:hypothetical protein